MERKKIDEHDSHLINDENQTDDDRYRKYDLYCFF